MSTDRSLTDAVCLVTGANRGIGAASARILADAGARVVLLCRDASAGQSVADGINEDTQRVAATVLAADLASLASVRRAADTLAAEHTRLDVLINNAAVVARRRTLSADGYELQFAVNHLAPFLLTNLLRPLLLSSAPARVINVSSGAHERADFDLDDLQLERGYQPYRAYRRTKLANVFFTRALARRLADTGVTVNAVHPGVIATGLLAALAYLPRPLAGLLRFVAKAPEEGARNVTFLATEPVGGEVSGAYFADRTRKAPSALAQDDDLAERLWTESERLTGWNETS